MNEEKTMNEVHSLLGMVTNNFFEGKRMPFEVAFALISMAWAFIEAEKGDEDCQFVVDKFKQDREPLPVIYPPDDVIQSAIDRLQELQEQLKYDDEIRSEWLFWDDQYETAPSGQQ